MKRSVFTGSPALELRDPLLDVRRDAFLRVVALEQLLLQLALERQPAFERHLGPGLHGALDQAHRLGSLVRRTELLRVKDHLLPEPLGGGDLLPQTPSAGNTPGTRPISFAGSNENVPPLPIISTARGFPTMRASRCVPPVPGSPPRFTSGRPILFCLSLASRRSHAMPISSPPPTVWPFSAAIVSLGVCSRRLSVSFACRQKKYL